jgi:hypothetical protein
MADLKWILLVLLLVGWKQRPGLAKTSLEYCDDLIGCRNRFQGLLMLYSSVQS